MSDEVHNTTLAYTKSIKLCKRTTFQEELMEAIAARLARLKSSECSDNCAGGESVSVADVSDTSVDENSVEKTLNDFQISDNEEKNSPKLSSLKTTKLNGDMMEAEPSSSTVNNEERAPDGCEDVVVSPLSEFRDEDQEIEKDNIKMKPKPRILPVKSTSSVSVADVSDTSVDENSVEKTLNDFQISDNEEKNSPKLSSLKITKLNGDMMEAEPSSSTINNEERAPDGCEDVVVSPSSQFRDEDQEIEKEKIKMKPKPRILPVKSTSSVSVADVSDTSVDENSVEKTLNDFQISDNEEKNSPKLSFLKTMKLNGDMMEDEPSSSTINNEERAPDGCEDVVVSPSSEFRDEDQEIEKEKIKMKPKPRILPVKSTSSVSVADVSDTSVDENSVEKTLNDFQISDNEEKNSPKLSFLKTTKLNGDMMEDEPSSSTINNEERAPDGCEDVVVSPSSEFRDEDQEIEKEKNKMKPKPRILPVKSTSSENHSSLEADNHLTPSPRPRSILKKHGPGEEKDGLGEETGTALCEDLEAHPAPAPLPRLNGRQLGAEREAFLEHLDPENPWLTSLSSSLNESLGNSFSPGSGGKTLIKDQNEEFTENRNSLKSNENQENSFLTDFINTALEKSMESQMTTDELEKEKVKLIMNEDLTVDPPLLNSQSMLIPNNATESAKKTNEDRIMKNKKSTNNRASSASSRLTTSEFLKNSSSIKRTPLKTTSSLYLGPLKVLDQKPSQKQYREPDRADDIRAAVYQEWLEKKNIYLQEKNRIKRIQSEKLRIQNEQKKVVKREEALAAFEAWKAMKEKEAKKIATQKRLEDKNKKKTEEENAARKVEAQQAFESWREKKKIEYLKEKNKKKKEYESAKKQKEEETVAEQRKDNLTAVGKWNEKNEALFKEKEKEKTNENIKELKRAEKKEKDKQAINEYEKCLNPWLTSLSSSLNESLENSFSPRSGEKTFIKDQNEEFTENRNSLKSNENQENTLLVDFINTALEKSKESQMTTDELEEEKEKAKQIMSDDLTVDPPLLKSQSMLIPTNATEFAKKTIEDKIMKNKKSTNNRASSAYSRLRTSQFLKNSGSVKRTPPKTTSSQYLGPLKVLDQKPTQKQYLEPDRADDIFAAVYQEWLEKKNIYLQEKNRIKRIQNEKLRIQNEQKKVAKREEALASFEAWKAMKEKEAKKIATQKRLEDKNTKKTKEENAARKVEAQQDFERWREKKKIEYLKEKNKKEKEYESAKKQKEEETVAEQRKDNLTTVEKWNDKKEAFFKEKQKNKTNEKRTEVKRAEKNDKDKQAINEYQKCLEKKERQERIKHKQKKHHSFLENEARPPWSPPSRIVFSRGF